MLDVTPLVQRALGPQYDFSVPSGPALVYLYRRYGPTEYGGDDYKQVCRYNISTAVEGLFVGVIIGAVDAFLHASMTRATRQRYQREVMRPVEAWYERCAAWARARGTPPRQPQSVADAQARLEGQGLFDPAVDDAARTTLAFFSYPDAHNEALTAAYAEVEPFPGWEAPPAPGTFAHECHTALEEALRDLLRPVQVRDVYINLLGRVTDPALLGEYDEEEGRFRHEAPRSPLSGYGVVHDVYRDPDRYFDFLGWVRQQGEGDMVAGMRRLMAEESSDAPG